MFYKKPQSIESAKIRIKFPNLLYKKRGFLSSQSNWGISRTIRFDSETTMDRANFTIGCLYALFLFTLFLIIQSDSVFIQMLPLMAFLALGYILLLLLVCLIILWLLKTLIDIYDLLIAMFNPPQGKFFWSVFYIANSFFCMRIKRYFFKII